jgi:hypothetical protein
LDGAASGTDALRFQDARREFFGRIFPGPHLRVVVPDTAP